MKQKFDLKEVTIVIDQDKMDELNGWYSLRATNPNSPIRICDFPKKVGEYFGCWLSNTIELMEANDCKTIKIKVEWE